MGGGDSTTDGTTTIRYAPYIEAHHEIFLNDTANYVASSIGNNPYKGFDGFEVDEGFFGAGYVLASYPSLYDIFGKFVAGLDVEALWNQIANESIYGAVINSKVNAESTILNDELDETLLPKFQVGMRDMNAVMTSSYVVGKALMLDTVTKQVSKISADLQMKMLDITEERWKSHLSWNQNVATNFTNIVKAYFAAKSAMENLNYNLMAKDAVWPLTVLDFEKANLGALQGAMTSNNHTTTSGGDNTAQWIGVGLSAIALIAMM